MSQVPSLGYRFLFQSSLYPAIYKHAEIICLYRTCKYSLLTPFLPGSVASSEYCHALPCSEGRDPAGQTVPCSQWGVTGLWAMTHIQFPTRSRMSSWDPSGVGPSSELQGCRGLGRPVLSPKQVLSLPDWHWICSSSFQGFLSPESQLLRDMVGGRS